MSKTSRVHCCVWNSFVRVFPGEKYRQGELQVAENSLYCREGRHREGNWVSSRIMVYMTTEKAGEDELVEDLLLGVDNETEISARE